MDRVERKRSQVAEALQQVRLGRREQLTVAQIMTAAPSCIALETTALDLVRMFHANGFRHLLVTDPSGGLLGVISDRDVLRCFGPHGNPTRQALEGIAAYQLMSSDVISVGAQTSVTQAVRMMIDHGISCLPVMADDAVVGIVTNTDLHIALTALLETAPSASSPQPVADGSVRSPQMA